MKQITDHTTPLFDQAGDHLDHTGWEMLDMSIYGVIDAHQSGQQILIGITGRGHDEFAMRLLDEDCAIETPIAIFHRETFDLFVVIASQLREVNRMFLRDD